MSRKRKGIIMIVFMIIAPIIMAAILTSEGSQDFSYTGLLIVYGTMWLAAFITASVAYLITYSSITINQIIKNNKEEIL